MSNYHNLASGQWLQPATVLHNDLRRGYGALFELGMHCVVFIQLWCGGRHMPNANSWQESPEQTHFSCLLMCRQWQTGTNDGELPQDSRGVSAGASIAYELWRSCARAQRCRDGVAFKLRSN